VGVTHWPIFGRFFIEAPRSNERRIGPGDDFAGAADLAVQSRPAYWSPSTDAVLGRACMTVSSKDRKRSVPPISDALALPCQPTALGRVGRSRHRLAQGRCGTAPMLDRRRRRSTSSSRGPGTLRIPACATAWRIATLDPKRRSRHNVCFARPCRSRPTGELAARR
jgi:hypothetical protein